MTYAIDRKGVAHKQLPHRLETVCGRKRHRNPKWSWGAGADWQSYPKLCPRCGAGQKGASA